jgi:hypothetical protein
MKWIVSKCEVSHDSEIVLLNRVSDENPVGFGLEEFIDSR